MWLTRLRERLSNALERTRFTVSAGRIICLQLLMRGLRHAKGSIRSVKTNGRSSITWCSISHVTTRFETVAVLHRGDDLKTHTLRYESRLESHAPRSDSG